MSQEKINEKRRNIIKAMLGISLLTGISSIASVGSYIGISPPPSFQQYPRIKIANINELKDKEPVVFCYPLTSTPNVLVKLGYPVKNGVGPNNDIVCYNSICQHLGCIAHYEKEVKGIYTGKIYNDVLFCACHYSVFDIKNDGKVLEGPAPREVPRVILEYDEKTGDIYAVGMIGPVIKGKGTEGKRGINLPENLRPGFTGGEIVNEITAKTCGRKSQ